MTVFDQINELVREKAQADAREVERRLMAGENEVRVPYFPGDYREVVYRVPAWRERPFRRLRIERMRRRHRLTSS